MTRVNEDPSHGQTSSGVWLAHSVDPYSGWGTVAAFIDEVSALRYALANSMHVTYVPYGSSVDDAQRAEREARA